MYEEQIANIYRKCEVTHFPIDCFAVMERMGFCVKSFTELLSENPELTFLRNNSTDALTITNRKETFYNDRKSRKRIRFTLMHELGHYVLKTKSETAADTFASEIHLLNDKEWLARTSEHLAEQLMARRKGQAER